MGKTIDSVQLNRRNFILPLGAEKTDGVYSFSVSLPDSKECSVCLFHENETEPYLEVRMNRQKNGIFYAEIAISPKDEKNTAYYYKTGEGQIVTDPYAKHILGRDVFGEKNKFENEEIKTLSLENRVETPLLSKLTDTGRFADDLYVQNKKEDLVLYELQIRSFTADPSSRVKHPGTFAGAAEKVPYLKKLGITGVLLLPVYDFNENDISGKTNLWGYDCRETCYFAPKAGFAFDKKDPCREFKLLVEKLHKASIDVYMELMFLPDTPKSMMMDAARYYAVIYGIDGFHINDYQIDPVTFLSDPQLANCRLLVTNTDDALLSAFPGRAMRFNNSFMNDMRRYLKGDEGLVPAFYDRMKNRGEGSGVTYMADHNGFSLYDLYSYDVKHNEANGENGRDGEEFNYSWNCGEEGETKNRKVRALRSKMIRNAVTTLFLTGGIPMLNAGDEFGFSKNGNNNTYCQDNGLSYLDWTGLNKNREIYSFVRSMIAFRNDHPMLKRIRDLRETDYRGMGIPEISLHGTSPWRVDYQAYNRLAGVYLCGAYASEDEESDASDLYVIYNMHWEKHDFVLPERRGKKLKVCIDTSGRKPSGAVNGGQITVEPRSIVVLDSETEK
ncbi:MAG: hypothetical protein IKS11_02460 [Lachnospiraceae bacterium]|nr:hypothetical protein [Lachnospiraceae bacterium]